MLDKEGVKSSTSKIDVSKATVSVDELKEKKEKVINLSKGNDPLAGMQIFNDCAVCREPKIPMDVKAFPVCKDCLKKLRKLLSECD